MKTEFSHVINVHYPISEAIQFFTPKCEDFRPPHVRTFADDLAAKDAVRRTEKFVRRHLQ